jgi:hypothetical protein
VREEAGSERGVADAKPVACSVIAAEEKVMHQEEIRSVARQAITQAAVAVAARLAALRERDPRGREEGDDG